MDAQTAGIISYLIKVTDGLANVALIGKPSAKVAVDAEIAALQAMVDEDRGPTTEEWEAHDASMQALKDELHSE